MHCPKCGHTLPDTATFCDSCGAVTGNGAAQPIITQPQQSDSSYCKYCGCKIDSNLSFCSKCGKPIGDGVDHSMNAANIVKNAKNYISDSVSMLTANILQLLTPLILLIMRSATLQVSSRMVQMQKYFGSSEKYVSNANVVAVPSSIQGAMCMGLLLLHNGMFSQLNPRTILLEHW